MLASTMQFSNNQPSPAPALPTECLERGWFHD